jgi:glycerophosphoryl diester phosphodiesterase
MAGAGFLVVAHRGVHTTAPENTLPAIAAAVEAGADAVEIDVRLTRDRVPVLLHPYYLQEVSDGTGPVFAHTLEALRRMVLLSRDDGGGSDTGARIATLPEALQAFAGRVGFEIEVKGPEPEAAAVVARVLADFRSCWDGMEVTSFEPAMLLDLRRDCPGLAADLLTPPPAPWMGEDVFLYQALHQARLAQARAVHLAHRSGLGRSGGDHSRTGYRRPRVGRGGRAGGGPAYCEGVYRSHRSGCPLETEGTKYQRLVSSAPPEGVCPSWRDWRDLSDEPLMRYRAAGLRVHRALEPE